MGSSGGTNAKSTESVARIASMGHSSYMTFSKKTKSFSNENEAENGNSNQKTVDEASRPNAIKPIEPS